MLVFMLRPFMFSLFLLFWVFCAESIPLAPAVQLKPQQLESAESWLPIMPLLSLPVSALCSLVVECALLSLVGYICLSE